MAIACIGLNHRTAPVSLRERFAVGDKQLPTVISELVKLPAVQEVVLLSTCNRMEIYFFAPQVHTALEHLRDYLHRHFQVEEHPFYVYHESEAVTHLWKVVSGVDSMVIGETEILGQVKSAYQVAHSEGVTGKKLNQLFQSAFRVAKAVRSETRISQGSVSVGSISVDLAEQIFGDLTTCRVLLLGAGETSRLTARCLLSRGVHSIFVSNRSYDKAQVLAEEMEGSALRFDQWEKELSAVDIVISSTSAPHILITPEHLREGIQKRWGRPLFMIDIAVPRDIDPQVDSLEGVYLYDIDSLQFLARQALDDRRQEIAQCEELIAQFYKELAPRILTEVSSKFSNMNPPFSLA